VKLDRERLAEYTLIALFIILIAALGYLSNALK
jgi:hypothetical protein